jgi:hypothetical protein
VLVPQLSESEGRSVRSDECRGGVQGCVSWDLKGVEACRDRKRGVSGEKRRETKSSRNGVHHANGVVWGPV